MKDSSHQVAATDSDVRQSVEPTERLLRRHKAPIGLVDVKHAERLYDRTAGWVAGRFALLDHWQTRYGSHDAAAISNSPFVFTITSEQLPTQSARIVSSEANLAGAPRQTSGTPSGSRPEPLRIRRRSTPPGSAAAAKEPSGEQSKASLPGVDAPLRANDPKAITGAVPQGEASHAAEIFTVRRPKARPPTELIMAMPISKATVQGKQPGATAPATTSTGDAQASATSVSSTPLQERHFDAQSPLRQSSSSPSGERKAPTVESTSISGSTSTSDSQLPAGHLDAPSARVSEIAPSPIHSDSPLPLPPTHVAAAEPPAPSAALARARLVGPIQAHDPAGLRAPAAAGRALADQALRGRADEQASRLRAGEAATHPTHSSPSGEAAANDPASPPRLVSAEIRPTVSAPLGSPAIVQLLLHQSSSSPSGERKAPTVESTSISGSTLTSDSQLPAGHLDAPSARVSEIAPSPIHSDSPLPLPPTHVAAAEPPAPSAALARARLVGPTQAHDPAGLRAPAAAGRTPADQALRGRADEQASRLRAGEAATHPTHSSPSGEAAANDPASSPRLVSAEIRPGSASETRPRMVWRKVADSLPGRDSLANGTSPGADTTFPIGSSRTGRNEPVVARQMSATPFAGAAEPGAASGATGVAPAAPQISSGQLDLAQLSEMVGRMISRQLAVERERRGIKRWN
jgi:hypothetical protein